MLQLAKPALDVGLYTNRIDEARAFYEGGLGLGLAYNHLLKAGRGVHQHRLDLPGHGVVKLNDPDGLTVEVVASLPGDARVEVKVASADLGAHDFWFADGLGAARIGELPQNL